MNGPITLAGSVIALGVGFATTYTALDLNEPAKPPAIHVEKIELRADGSTHYDRTTEDGKWLAWSGQVFKDDKTLHCRGGGTSQYFGEENPLDTKDINWLVAEGCSEGLKEGMTWVFTWTPLDSDYADVRYPAKGVGVVLPPKGD